jgi:phosphoribosylaminoimidazole (AIR) synthetase
MTRVFNLGLGYVVCCRADAAERVLALAGGHGARQVGAVRARVGDEAQVVVEGLGEIAG